MRTRPGPSPVEPAVVPPLGSYWSVNHRDGVQRTIEALAAASVRRVRSRTGPRVGCHRSHDRASRRRGYLARDAPRRLPSRRGASHLRTVGDGGVPVGGIGELASHTRAPRRLWEFEGVANRRSPPRCPGSPPLALQAGDSAPRSQSPACGRRSKRPDSRSPRRYGRRSTWPRSWSEAALEVAIESALRRRLFSVGQLRWRAEPAGRHGPSRERLARAPCSTRADPDSAGVVGRCDSRVPWNGAGLGTPARQHPVRAGSRVIATVDLAYPKAQVAIEYDSDQWHHGVARRHRDVERRNRLRGGGMDSGRGDVVAAARPIPASSRRSARSSPRDLTLIAP